MSDAQTTRVRAAQALAAVVAGQSLSVALPQALAGLAGRDRAFVHELVYGSLRWYGRLDAMLRQLLRQPLKRRDQDVYCLLLLGLYQLLYLEVKPYAAVHATVDAVKLLGKPWAAKLANGVLRNFQRQAEALATAVDAEPTARLAHPAWLLQALQHDWPADWQDIAAANNQQPPLFLRVNVRQGSRADYLAALHAAGVDAVAVTATEQGILIRDSVAIEALPGYVGGRFSVQDAAAQFAAELLDVQPGMRVLDACAAPGGKTAHILERQPQLRELVAVDIDSGRLQRIEENLARLQLAATLRTGDAAAPDTWWDGNGFDRILLDAPCSASGVIRRHPDIKLHRRQEDMARLTAVQSRLLEALWPLLLPGGMLLYATCSVMNAENAEQIAAFITRHADAHVQPLQVDWGRPSGPGRQILPIVTASTEPTMDGFYYACVSKRAG